MASLHSDGFTVLKAQFARPLIEACHEAFGPYFAAHATSANRGLHRHFLPLPFSPPIFDAAFFFCPEVLELVERSLGQRFVADQWHSDTPVSGSGFQEFHADYRRPLFEESPDLPLPPYMLVMSFPLVDITLANGPLEIAPGTHRMPRAAALSAIASGEIRLIPILMKAGDILIRHPWTLHRGTPNTTAHPRPLLSIRYVRRWYADDSRAVCSIPAATWDTLTDTQRNRLRFPRVGGQ